MNWLMQYLLFIAVSNTYTIYTRLKDNHNRGNIYLIRSATLFKVLPSSRWRFRSESDTNFFPSKWYTNSLDEGERVVTNNSSCLEMISRGSILTQRCKSTTHSTCICWTGYNQMNMGSSQCSVVQKTCIQQQQVMMDAEVLNSRLFTIVSRLLSIRVIV